jgi:hypothetical protein
MPDQVRHDGFGTFYETIIIGIMECWNHGIMGSGQLGKWFKKTSQSGSTFKTRFFKGKIFIDAENNE